MNTRLLFRTKGRIGRHEAVQILRFLQTGRTRRPILNGPDLLDFLVDKTRPPQLGDHATGICQCGKTLGRARHRAVLQTARSMTAKAPLGRLRQLQSGFPAQAENADLPGQPLTPVPKNFRSPD
ncbi:hypothetical protein [Belnapia sp. F-4-1]|uniref:hypothetical protein n=1 Tax=Belnapia sp. F-4-1 TaxID=1545443 RepID=UPI0011852FF2|nr:hypothetical protein [Belnapia sp. F-4-1]